MYSEHVGSPPGKMSVYDWKSVAWTLAAAAIGAALTAVLDGMLESVLPDLQDKKIIDGTMFTLLTAIVHALRKYVTETRVVKVTSLFIVAWLALSGSVMAEDVAVLIDNTKPGSYMITVSPEGVVTANPIKAIRPGGTPPIVIVPSPPDGTPASPLTLKIEEVTKTVLSQGGTKTTAAALSSAVYSLAADQLADGKLKPEDALTFVKMATNIIAQNVPDGQLSAWTTWRTAVGDMLTEVRGSGHLSTKEDYIKTFREIAAGLDRASGNKLSSHQVMMRSPAALGILDGIDLAKLVELIKLVMELMKIFGG